MAGIDKAAIAFSIAIVAIGAGFAFYMGGVQDAGLVSSVAPTISTTTPTESSMDKEEPMMMEEEPMMMEEEPMMMEEKTPEEPAGPQTHIVDMPEGTAAPGCEATNECYIPADITINAGDTVEWINLDTAAHTVTGGSPSDGPSGVFDSSLVMADATYAFTFEEAGYYDYFCMVHPWMVGSVTVN